MVGLIDGSLSTLAPIFSVAVVTHKPHYAFVAGVATAFGAGISMAFSEGLSDTGELTGRGNPLIRCGSTGAGPLRSGVPLPPPLPVPYHPPPPRPAALLSTLPEISLPPPHARRFRPAFTAPIP